MPTAAERQALAFLAGVALLGGGARVWMQHRAGDAKIQNETTVSAETVEGQLSAIDSAKASHRGKKRASKSFKTAASRSSRASGSSTDQDQRVQIIDVDIASTEELERLPRVGPALAARIVANRDSLGAFGSLEALGAVRGIGPAMLKTLSPVVTFSGRPRVVRAK